MQARHFMAVLFAGALAAVALPTDAAAQANWRQQQENRGRQMRHRGMDTDGDGVITRADWRGNQQSFRQQDTNDDNVLSGAEVWTQSGSNNSPQDQELREDFARADRNNDRVLSRDEWYGDRQTFERIDSNDDGRISFAEFQGQQVEGTSGVQESFETLDRNNNGVLTLSEWTGARAHFDALDTDNDGVISRVEFRQSVNRTPAFRAGFERGLTEGRQAGSEDKNRNGGVWDLEGQRELEQADSGYNTSMGARNEYQNGYRQGFRRGYAEGFGRR